MSDLEPPEWFDNAPPATVGASRGGKPNNRPQPTREEVQTASADFFAWLVSVQCRQELTVVLPDYINIDQFIAICKDAALTNPKLLLPVMRASLMMAIVKAAKMGLRPDGKEGVLVPRWDSASNATIVVFQPMVWGIVSLGRRTGAIESIRAVIVYNGEHFEIEEGDTQVYRHKVNRQIASEAYQALYGGMTDGKFPRLIANSNDYFSRVDCAYAIFKSSAGVITKRWMPKSRINLIRVSQGPNTPWYGPFVDEMICKTVILFTAKHVDLDISNPATERFREAMQHDMEVDFERDDRIGAPNMGGVGLIGHETRLDAFENLHAPDTREKVDVGKDTQEAPERTQTPQQQTAPEPQASRPAQPGDAPMTAPRRDVDIWAATVREAIEKDLTKSGQVKKYAAHQKFVQQMELARKIDPKVAEEIEDALQDRETFLLAKEKDGL